MDDTPPVARLSIEIQEECIEQGAIKVLSQIRPKWTASDIQFKLLTDGITNKLIRCCLTEDSEDVVLVRVYGKKTDLLIDRKAETRNIILLHNENLAPRLYATFENGLAYEYVPGVTLTTETVIDPKIYSLVAVKMAQLHLVKTGNNNSSEPMLWNKLEQFYNLIPDEFSDADKQERFKSMNYPKARLLQEMRHLKDILTKLHSPIVFAHNDLLLGNVIYNSEHNSVTFIDYEYAAMNYQAYDIGNHFSEFAGVESVDYSRYPSKELQWEWLRIYLQAYHNTNNISDDMIEDLYIQVNQFALATHLLWGIWALIQAEHSTINFNFIHYGALRFGEYFAKKEEFLALKK